VTQEYRVEGPVMIFLTTTAMEIEEELRNRAVVLTVDEEREQTRAIHRLQRERQTLGGLLAIRERDRILKLHRDAQRLLRPLLVINPYAMELTFLDDRTRTRRDHMKYLTLIKAITLLHQYQRPIKEVEHRGEVVPYIEVTPSDIDIANRLAHQVLGRSLDDLAPQTRRLLMLLDEMVSEASAMRCMERGEYRFARRQVQEHTGWSYKQVRVHLQRLVEIEYLLVHAGRRNEPIIYELIYQGEGKDGQAFTLGLLDVERLRGKAVSAAPDGVTARPLPPGCPPIARRLPDGKTGQIPNEEGRLNGSLALNPENAVTGVMAEGASYPKIRCSAEAI
jgi:hypothetical protein